MESKKVNLFAFLMVIVMCVFSIFIGIKKDDKNANIQNELLSIMKELEKRDKRIDELETEIDNTKGKSAYEIAVKNGFVGSEGEWLQSLKGTNGTNALTTVSLRDIYSSYLQTTNQTETDMPYEEFLSYYYSVVEKYDAKTATQLAYSSTVDICYSYSSYMYTYKMGLYAGEDVFVLDGTPGKKGSASAGAGVIYDMIDTDIDGVLDTAYIITNYHVAYIAQYTNNTNHAVYYDVQTKSSFISEKLQDEDILSAQTYQGDLVNYFKSDAVSPISIHDGISEHFLIGTDNQYYGIYVYGYQKAEYRLAASFVGGSADNDIAVLKIERENLSDELAGIFFDSGNFVEAEFGNSSDLVGGEDVIAVGNPLIPNKTSDMTIEEYEKACIDALVLSSTTGVVSSISNEMLFSSLIESGASSQMRLIRVDAAINSGNSGGGLYDLYGKLVGIVNSKIASEAYDNVGYAIPINIVDGVVRQIINQCEGNNPVSLNTRIKALKTENLGFGVENGVSKSRVEINSNGQKEWLVSYNILIKDVEDESIAKTSGLKDGDIILEVVFGGLTYKAEQFFNLDYEFRDLLLKVDIEETQLTLKVSRMGDEKIVNINLSVNDFKEII